MATLNRTVPAYTPRGFNSYAIPVQQGSVRNLCPSVTPTGQGILSWVDRTADELRCAVVPDWRLMFQDNVVDSGDVRTVFSAGSRTLYTGVCWQWQGTLYAFVSHWDESTFNGKIECYSADDVEDPTSWSLVGTVQDISQGSDAGVAEEVRQGGPPVVLDTGRWLLPFHAWAGFPGIGGLIDMIGMHFSDDEGATWTTAFSHRRSAGAGGTAGPQSTTIAADASDDLWFGSHIGSVAQWRPYQSSDGSSWTDNEQSGGNYVPHYYIDDGINLYAALVSSVGDTTVDLYRVDDPTDPATWEDLGLVALTSASSDFEDGLQIVPLLTPGGGLLTVAVSWRERIARDSGGWHVGFVGS